MDEAVNKALAERVAKKVAEEDFGAGLQRSAKDRTLFVWLFLGWVVVGLAVVFVVSNSYVVCCLLFFVCCCCSCLFVVVCCLLLAVGF